MNVRKLISTVTILLVSFLAGTGLTSCQKEVEGVTEIIFTNVPSGKLKLAVGDEFKVKYLVLPETMQETAEIEWTTSDKNVARIRRGNIQAEGPGKAIITATSGNATASISVTVNAVKVENLDFPDEPFEVYLNATVKVFFENVVPKNASLTTVDWEVKKYVKGDATVEADDDCIYITGTEVGVAELYGYIDGVEIDHQEIEIKERIPVKSVSVTLSKPSVIFGESLTVSTDVQPSNASLKDVAITCTPSNLATVSGNTITAGNQAGKVTVSATADGVTGTAEFEIVPPPLKLTIGGDLGGYNFLSPDGSVEDYPASAQLTLKANYDVDLSGVEWTSSKPAVATVDKNGLVTAVGHGWTDITAKVKTIHGEGTVSLRVRSIKKSSLSLCIYKYNDAGDTKIPLTSLQAPYNMIGAYCADPEFLNDPDRYSMDDIYKNIQISSCTAPFTAHMEGNYLVVNASSAGTGSITLSIPGGKNLTVPVTMKITSLTFIGYDSRKNYGTVQKGGSLTITREDSDPREGYMTYEAIEVWRNVGSSKDNTSLCDRGFLSWESNIMTRDPFDYGALTRKTGTHVIKLKEFDPDFTVTLTITEKGN